MKFYYQSSMPRAGSTLLQNVMGQNPEFYVTPTSPLCEFIGSAKAVQTYSVELKAQENPWRDKALHGWLKQGMQGIYSEIAPAGAKYVLDKSRAWVNSYGLLNWIEPNPKVVVMVRSLEDVLASFESKYRQNPQYPFGIEDTSKIARITLPERLTYYMNSFPLGMYLARLQESMELGDIKKMHVIRYEDLCTNPEQVVRSIYDFFELPYYEGHDFNNVKQITWEDDKTHGPFGDHKIKEGAISLEPSKAFSLFSPSIIENIRTTNRWYYDNFGYSF